MNRTTLAATAMVCATTLILSGLLARAGSLTPPSGPVAPTPGPEPRTPLAIGSSPAGPTDSIIIDQPGSYYLTGNLTGEPDKNGILITSSHVNLDLMGFTLTGSTGDTNGILVDTNQPLTNIEIRNGTLKDWNTTGILCFTATNVRLRNIHVDGGSQLYAIRTGDESSIIDCSATNAIPGGIGGGIRAASRCRLERCYAANNRASGIVAVDETYILDCTSVDNGGDGFDIENRCVVLNSHAGNNDADEIVCQGDASRVEGCTFRHETDPIGVAAIKIQGERNVIRANAITITEPDSAAIDVQTGRANFLAANTIETTPTATDAVALRLLGGAGSQANQIVLDGPGSIGILLDPGPGAPEICCGEEDRIAARAANTVAVRVSGGAGALVDSLIAVSGPGALAVDIEPDSSYAVRRCDITLFEPNTIGVRIAAPSYIEQGNLRLLGDDTIGILETTTTNSLIRANTFHSRGATPTAISATTFGNSFMTRNTSIGAAAVYALPEGVQYGQLLVDPGSGYTTDSGANLQIGP